MGVDEAQMVEGIEGFFDQRSAPPTLPRSMHPLH